MDRALKERMTGAIVLVALAVLVVPVFLDGSAGNDVEIVTEGVTLPGQNMAGQETRTVVLSRDRTEPVPASPAPAVAEPAPRATPAATTPEPAAETANDTSDAPVPGQSSTGMFAVQLGSFSSRENAERLAASLRDQGYAAFLSNLDTGSGPLHRVRVGPQKDRDSAESIAEQLQKSGHNGQVVPHP